VNDPDAARAAAHAELAALAAEASVCRLCPLARTRTNVVFGVGNPDAALMFVGEAPGQSEDEQGVPFVGRAGALLTELLGGIGLSRGAVYIANVIKCRPPGNRDPEPQEIVTCRPYLERQIELIDPKVIATLGNFATKLLLGTQVGITRLRGNRYVVGGRSIVPTFHPAAVLRGGFASLADARADFVLLRRVLDEAEPPPEVKAPLDPAVARPVEAEQLGLFG